MKKIPPGPGEEFWNLESSFEISVKTLSAMGRIKPKNNCISLGHVVLFRTSCGDLEA